VTKPEVWDWRAEAACRGRPTRIWYSTDPLEVAIALQVCRSCPVREPCRVEGRDEPGVWGGSTDEQRQRQRVA
jgi:hypothetical protein